MNGSELRLPLSPRLQQHRRRRWKERTHHLVEVPVLLEGDAEPMKRRRIGGPGGALPQDAKPREPERPFNLRRQGGKLLRDHGRQRHAKRRNPSRCFPATEAIPHPAGAHGSTASKMTKKLLQFGMRFKLGRDKSPEHLKVTQSGGPLELLAQRTTAFGDDVGWQRPGQQVEGRKQAPCLHSQAMHRPFGREPAATLHEFAAPTQATQGRVGEDLQQPLGNFRHGGPWQR